MLALYSTLSSLLLLLLLLSTPASASSSAVGDGTRQDAAAAAVQSQGGSMQIFPRQSARPGEVLIANLQPFSGRLGGFSAPEISQSKDSSRPFEVDGNTFTDFSSAADRACDNQKNECADAANKGGSRVFSVGDCDSQNNQCKSAAKAAKDSNFATFSFADAENEYFCED